MKFFEIDEEYLKKGGLISRDKKSGLAFGIVNGRLVAFKNGIKKEPEEIFKGYARDLLADDWEYVTFQSGKKWKPYNGDRYYFIDCMNTCSYYTYANDELDNALSIIGNCFESEKEAKHMVEKLKIITKLRELTNVSFYKSYFETKYVIYYDSVSKKIKINTHECIRELPFNIYFATREDCEKAIKEIGEENLKKYYFDVVE